MKARALSAASLAAAGVLLLTGCATAITGSAQAAATLPTSQSAVEESTAEEPIASETTETETEQSPTPIPPTAPSTDGASSAPGDGGALYADSIAWLSAFCYGFDDVMQYTDFDTTGMSDEATLQTIADAYTGMSQAADAAAYQLEVLPPPTFPGADTIAPAIQDWLLATAANYADGADAIAYGTFETVDDLNATIGAIEAGMDDANSELSAAMGGVDPSVKTAVAGLPECASLLGN